jgi:hypothetical protein
MPHVLYTYFITKAIHTDVFFYNFSSIISIEFDTAFLEKEIVSPPRSKYFETSTKVFTNKK